MERGCLNARKVAMLTTIAMCCLALYVALGGPMAYFLTRAGIESSLRGSRMECVVAVMYAPLGDVMRHSKVYYDYNCWFIKRANDNIATLPWEDFREQ